MSDKEAVFSHSPEWLLVHNTLFGAFDEPENEKAELEAENKRLKGIILRYADMFDRWAAENDGRGSWMDAVDWLALANDMRIDVFGTEKMNEVEP